MGSKALDLAMIFVTLFLLIIFSVVFIVRYFRKAYHLANDPENRCVCKECLAKRNGLGVA